MSFTIVIPARYASTRLPGKPLLDIAGKPMIQHVHERAQESGADKIVIATDDQRVAEVCEGFGAKVCMTSADHNSGTERLSEVVEKLALGIDEIVVNVQGDEPLIPPALIQQVANNLDIHPLASIATLAEKIESVAELFDPNAVKVISDHTGYAIYFSRATIPWSRDAFAVSQNEMPTQPSFFRHIGIYAYRAGFINKYVALPPCELEQVEALEQLRAIWHGYKIHVEEVAVATEPGVDTEADLERTRLKMAKA